MDLLTVPSYAGGVRVLHLFILYTELSILLTIMNTSVCTLFIRCSCPTNATRNYRGSEIPFSLLPCCLGLACRELYIGAVDVGTLLWWKDASVKPTDGTQSRPSGLRLLYTRVALVTSIIRWQRTRR